jgi:hypothetical protein
LEILCRKTTGFYGKKNGEWGVSKLGFCAVYFGNKHCLFENTHVYLEKNTTPSGLGYFPSV